MDAVIYALASQLLKELENVNDVGRWTARADMPTARRFLAAAPLSGDRVLVVGGSVESDSSGQLATVERYDDASNTWTVRSDMPTARRYLAAAPLSGDRVLVVGGDSGGARTAAERYDDATNTWTARANMPTARSRLAAASLSGDRVLAVGGYSSGSGYLATVQRYDDASNAWTGRANVPTARSSHAAAPLSGDRVLVVGGYSSSSGYLATVQRYDDATNIWTARSNMLTARSNLAAAPLSGDRVLVVGGSVESDSSGQLATVERYDDASNTWTVRSDMPAARNFLAAAPLSGDRVLVVGGSNSSGYLATAERYDDDIIPAVRQIVSTIQSLAAIS